MKEFFTTKVRVLVAIAALLAIITVGSMILRPGEATIMNNIMSMVVNPLKNGVTILVNEAERLYDYIFGYETIRAENDLLREQMANMNQDIRNSQTYKEENVRLRSLLNFSEKNTDYVMEIANVVAWNSAGYGSTVTISKGSTAGLAEGMCAITESGQVVGLISEVGSNWATVTTILDTTSEIGAHVFGSGYTCIAHGDFELMNDGYLRASYLASDATIRNSDQILTSGDGDIYPPGLVLGTVYDVGDDETNVAKYAVLAPTVDLSSVAQVFIIKSYNIND